MRYSDSFTVIGKKDKTHSLRDLSTCKIISGAAFIVALNNVQLIHIMYKIHAGNKA